MIYLFVNNNRIRALFFKKSLLGNFEVDFFEKKFQLNITQDGKITNTDILASAVKEVLNSLSPTAKKDKEIVLIIPQPVFKFLRTEIPVDLTSAAVSSFINDKIVSLFSLDLQNYFFDYFFTQRDGRQQISVYAIDRAIIREYQESLRLLDLKIVNVVPETAAYFKLFDKTIRHEKKEIILYGAYDKEYFFAYLYDSFGLIDGKRIDITQKSTAAVEKELKLTASNFEKEKKKVNRLILSGVESEKIRQDTFTKNTGMWTNPLKKIIANFYQEYLKIFSLPNTKPFPILTYDVCLGAYIFLTENKNFSLVKGGVKIASPFPKKNSTGKSVKKEYLIFIFSFVISFIFFVVISKANLKFSLPALPATPTATPPPAPTSTPTPTPAFKKEELKIKVLNGSGVAGKASVVKDILKKAGYGEILTGNADTFDFKTTVIQVKKSAGGIFDTLKTELKDYTTTLRQETLDEKESADVIFIVGQDFK